MDVRSNLNLALNNASNIGNMYDKSYIDHQLNAIDSKISKINVSIYKTTFSVTTDQISQSSGNYSKDITHNLNSKNIIVSLMEGNVMLTNDASNSKSGYYKVEYPSENVILINVHQPGNFYVTIIG